MSKQHNRYKYAIEHRRALQRLQHPPEVILIKEDTLDDELTGIEMVYGYGNYGHMPGGQVWKPVVDDLPFPSPQDIRNPFREGGYF